MKAIGNRHFGVVGAALCVLAVSGTAHGQWTVNGNDAYFNLSGHLGVGTTSPSYKLHVAESANADGTRAIYGFASATTGVVNGVYGQTPSSGGRGVLGYATSTTGTTYGVVGLTPSIAGTGVWGLAQATSGTTYGVFGQSASTTGTGVFGWATNTGFTSASSVGVQGESDSAVGSGVVGLAAATTGSNRGVVGQSNSNSGVGVYGTAITTTGTTTGLYGGSASSSGFGAYAEATATTGGTIGVYGRSVSTSGVGVYGDATATTGTAVGVYGRSINSAAGSYGVFSSGNTGATGTKAFCIDHPADPQNKYLLHYSIESSEVLNSYSGKVRLDGAGMAVVDLPAYFASVNTDPRYTLAAVGAPMPLLHIAQEISEAALADGARAEPGKAAAVCSFRIAGGAPGGKVSWRIEAVRNDPWVRAHGAPVEVEKPDLDRGTYLQPELFGKPAEMGTYYRPAPEAFLTALPKR